MQRGEVWWAEFDERRPVVLLSGDDASGIRVMQVVARAGVDITGLGVEVAVGAVEGLSLFHLQPELARCRVRTA